MGEARRRGTYEQRRAAALERRRLNRPADTRGIAVLGPPPRGISTTVAAARMMAAMMGGMGAGLPVAVIGGRDEDD